VEPPNQIAHWPPPLRLASCSCPVGRHERWSETAPRSSPHPLPSSSTTWTPPPEVALRQHTAQLCNPVGTRLKLGKKLRLPQSLISRFRQTSFFSRQTRKNWNGQQLGSCIQDLHGEGGSGGRQVSSIREYSHHYRQHSTFPSACATCSQCLTISSQTGRWVAHSATVGAQLSSPRNKAIFSAPRTTQA
jgi:hypothetical protein